MPSPSLPPETPSEGPDSETIDPQVVALRNAGDQRRNRLAEAFEAHRPRLARMVRMRMHPAIRARLDPSDVLQEAAVEIDRRLDAFLEDPRLPLFLWMRLITAQELMKAHRKHLEAKRRDARRQAAPGDAFPNATTFAIAEHLAAAVTSPSQGAAREEARVKLLAQIETLSDVDRNVISMRHFEGLTNEEVAVELGLSKHGASKRYIRALTRLKDQVGELDI